LWGGFLNVTQFLFLVLKKKKKKKKNTKIKGLVLQIDSRFSFRSIHKHTKHMVPGSTTTEKTIQNKNKNKTLLGTQLVAPERGAEHNRDRDGGDERKDGREPARGLVDHRQWQLVDFPDRNEEHLQKEEVQQEQQALKEQETHPKVHALKGIIKKKKKKKEKGKFGLWCVCKWFFRWG
jgi:hypothetical protein